MGHSSTQNSTDTQTDQQEANAPPGVSPFRQLVAAQLRATAAEKGITGAALARRLGVSESYTSRRLSATSAVDTDDLERIAAAMGLSLEGLLLQLAHRAHTAGLDEPTVPIPQQRDRAHRPGRHRKERST
jgi:transcriptional regulator with XRE-family HTH domain